MNNVMIEENFLPTNILKNMKKQNIFEDLLVNIKRRYNHRRITNNAESNFLKILEQKVETIDRINNQLNGNTSRINKNITATKINKRKTSNNYI